MKNNALKEENSLLSVIVPVYNVEKYLRQCCDSILAQRYTNLEILLIDDGSTDASGSICDEYARQDQRIRVFHKANEGLGATRNFGIRQASGEYVGFVDSDDWIYEDMYFLMMEQAHRQKADIVCCNYDLQFDNRIIERSTRDIASYPTNEAVVNLLYPQYYMFYAPNKIFSRKIFEGLAFPVGKHFEDIPTVYQAFLKSDWVYFVKKSGYVYRQRRDSITNSQFNPKSAEMIEAIDFVLQDGQKRFPDKTEELMVGYLRYYISFLDKAILGRASDLKDYEDRVQSLVRQNAKAIIMNRKLSGLRKIQFLCCGYAVKMYEHLVYAKAKTRL